MHFTKMSHLCEWQRAYFRSCIGIFLHLKVAQCQLTGIFRSNESLCYTTISGRTCFTTFLATNNHLERRSFAEASQWCKTSVPGSSLILVKNVDSQGIVEDYTRRQLLANETILMDARMLSASESEWSLVNGDPYFPDHSEGKCRPLHDKYVGLNFSQAIYSQGL